MSSIGHEIPQTTSSDSYANEAAQVVLRALDGSRGTWVRHEPRINLSDLISGSTNDNGRGRR